MPKKTKSEHYVDNAQFFKALVDHKKQVRLAEKNKTEVPIVPEYIGECLIKIANHFSHHPHFIGYVFREDMVLDAVENCLTYLDNFNPRKSKNPFAYFSQICYYAFLRRIQKEKKHLKTKYNYIASLDVDSIVLQAHDAGEYNNSFIAYLQEQADEANVHLQEVEREKKFVRRPKYLDKKGKRPKKKKRRKAT